MVVEQGTKQKAFRAALPYTLPICAGFLFLGTSYGYYMSSQGFSLWYPVVMSMLIFAGSMEFVAVGLLLSTYNPLYAFLLTIMVNARHLFYGISMLDKFKDVGKKKWYLIFGMCDESFSINCSVKLSPAIDKGWFMLFVTLLNHIYWVVGAALGALLGQFISLDTRGIEFVMTALFVVIFMEQWSVVKRHMPAIIGIGASLISLFVFGADQFMIPAMIMIVISLTAARSQLEDGERSI